jgi:transposase-like protein
MEGRRFVPQWVPQPELFKVLDLQHNWIAFADEELPFPVAVSLGRAPDGRLIITGMLIANLDIPAVYDEDAPDWFRSKPVEITTRSLRRLHVPDLLNSVTALRDDPKGKALFDRLFGLADDLPASFPRRRPGPKGHPREHFEMVARAYRRALAEAPGAPVKTLAKQLHASEATVRRWIQRARDMGLLGPSTAGKAGEQPAGEVDQRGAGRDSSPPTPDPKEGR